MCRLSKSTWQKIKANLAIRMSEIWLKLVMRLFYGIYSKTAHLCDNF